MIEINVLRSKFGFINSNSSSADIEQAFKRNDATVFINPDQITFIYCGKSNNETLGIIHFDNNNSLVCKYSEIIKILELVK